MTLQAVSPGADLTFSNDWTTWLPSGDSISSRVWSITPDEGSMIADNTATIASVSGFVRGTIYYLEEQITSGTGLIAKRGFTLVCETSL